MATSKKTFTTCKGVAVYPHLNKPDFAFNSDGVYTTKLRVPANDAKPLMDTVRALAQDEFGKAATSARMPWKIDEETGDVVLLAKSKYKSKFMDSSGKLIPEAKVPDIFGGSVLKLAGSLYAYNAGGSKGISMQLGGVQIVTLADPVGTFAFEAEEDGYIAGNDNQANDNHAGEAADGETTREAYDF